MSKRDVGQANDAEYDSVYEANDDCETLDDWHRAKQEKKYKDENQLPQREVVFFLFFCKLPRLLELDE